MKNLLLVLCVFFLLSTITNAARIDFAAVSAEGTYVNNLSLLTDGTFPGEGTRWDSTATVQFSRYSENANTEYFTFDMGSLHTIDDIIISVDNNDSYKIEYSTDNSTWSSLTTAYLSFGEVGGGMDTLSSFSGNTEYVSGLDFDPSGPARYIRIYVDGWANVISRDFSEPRIGDGAFAIGEFQAFGDVFVQSSPVPEPGTMLLFGLGLLGLSGISRKRKP
ncbi:MAG: discoidin domain-containing protein [Proteobacteria bacterium]|nr:discoidin domain-containing protein [Pseudomonadota bacterium]MBU1388839.1 discoidin domain-containing protein [Pseudomonadota bacterium]MBU1542220.1 discoidin domain-containing protein [Pseudomonadota bacterium]MBU2429864.1 discoidin domain-containing protein [Pseudomonadota bacterium]MBU2480410.1 discoidin domain-containing protein [Pseudomonadota bacterium]